MKKCTRFMDLNESSNLTEDSAAWKDIIMHAASCPDCSLAMRERDNMLEALAELPEPDYPAELNTFIMSRIHEESAYENIEGSASKGFIEQFLDLSLRPLEFVIPAACVLMFVFFLGLESHNEPEPVLLRADASRIQGKARQPEGKNLSGQLQKVEVAEVNEFLRRLDEFNRKNPENIAKKDLPLPTVELVNDSRYWRKP